MKTNAKYLREAAEKFRSITANNDEDGEFYVNRLLCLFCEPVTTDFLAGEIQLNNETLDHSLESIALQMTPLNSEEFYPHIADILCKSLEMSHPKAFYEGDGIGSDWRNLRDRYARYCEAMADIIEKFSLANKTS